MLTEENWRNFINESKYVSGIYVWIFQKPLKKIHDLLLENSNQRDSAWMHDIHGAATWKEEHKHLQLMSIKLYIRKQLFGSREDQLMNQLMNHLLSYLKMNL